LSGTEKRGQVRRNEWKDDVKRIPKQEYAAEFKEQAVKRADEVGSIGRAAEELGLVK